MSGLHRSLQYALLWNLPVSIERVFYTTGGGQGVWNPHHWWSRLQALLLSPWSRGHIKSIMDALEVTILGIPLRNTERAL
jgi:hypothetical protein